MAKKPKSKTAKVKPSEVIRIMPQAEFGRLLKRVLSIKKDQNGTSERLRQLISNAAEKQFLHKKAFAMYLALDKIEDDNKLATTIAHLDHYIKIGGLRKRAGKQGQMFARTEAGEKPKAAVPAAPKKAAEGDINQLGRGNVRTLTNPRLVPSPAAVSEIADRAQQGR